MINTTRYETLHNQMLEFQREIAPFTPTIRDMVGVWSLKSTSVAEYYLRKLAAMGLVTQRNSGNHKRYYAVCRTRCQNCGKPCETPVCQWCGYVQK